jgi:hypothetical protein
LWPSRGITRSLSNADSRPQPWTRSWHGSLRPSSLQYSSLKLISILKMTVFWDVAPCSLVEIRRRFRGVCYPIIVLMMEASSISETSVNFYTKQHLKRQSFLYLSPWEPEISPNMNVILPSPRFPGKPFAKRFSNQASIYNLCLHNLATCPVERTPPPQTLLP